MTNKASSGPTLMALEAREAPEVVRKQLIRNQAVCEIIANEIKSRHLHFAVVCARGSSGHAGTYAKYLIEYYLHINTAPASPSLNSVYNATTDMSNTLLLVISQSGKSPDLLAFTEAAKQSGAYIVAIINTEDAPLADIADIVLPISAGPERSVAATKSYIASCTAIAQLVGITSQNKELNQSLVDLPDLLEQACEMDWSTALEPVSKAQSLFAISRGAALGIVREVALKFKETAILHAEAFSAAEVIHGPLALVNPGFICLVFDPVDQSSNNIKLLVNKLREYGAEVFVISSNAPEHNMLPIPAHKTNACTPIVQVQSFYLFVEQLSRLRGYNPDTPQHLKKVTETR